MKHSLISLSVLVCAFLGTSTSFASKRRIPDLPPDATSEEYQRLLKQNLDPQFEVTDGLDDILAAGTRSLQWLAKINATRPDGSKISFTDPNHRPGYPIDKPRIYSPSMITAQYRQFLSQAPQEFIATVTGDKDLPTELPKSISLSDYISWGHTLDSIYQISSRWRLMAPDLEELAQISANDVRGYYFLSTDVNHEAKLSHYQTLSAADQAQVRDWLVQMCRNATQFDSDKCRAELSQSVASQNGSALNFYSWYLQAAKDHYDSYFKIPDGAARTDITWPHDQPNLAVIPFIDPMSDTLRKFMLNVEDEWHWGDWHLHLNFITSDDVTNTPHLTFEAGATPHVNAIAGNIITMDQNTPLTDWEVNWTIRHEFGHVLGFLDCYIEFYDKANQTMVAYQLDVTNLMCSRQGNLKEIHYDELKRVYFK